MSNKEIIKEFIYDSDVKNDTIDLNGKIDVSIKKHKTKKETQFQITIEGKV